MPRLGSTCCDANLVTDNGYNTCTRCGSVVSRELDVKVKSFQQSVSKAVAPYTRKKRFCHKILGALLGRVGH